VRDQYAIAVGGVTAVTLEPGGEIGTRRLAVPDDTLAELRDRLLLFFAGERQPGAQMLAPLVQRSGEAAMTTNLRRTADLAREVARSLEAGDLAAVGSSMAEQWALKVERTPAAVTERIAALHAAATGPGGATGAVLAGAGGGGFLLVHSEDPELTRAAMAAVEAPELRFAVEPRGCTAGPA
jgi:galactokinase/mevalonate kinase-like predicted kinase